MKKAGVEKARKRLALARHHFDEAFRTQKYEKFEDSWYQMLVCGNAVDGILESTSFRDSKSQPWYGGKVSARKRDPLLEYMHQARNADEHGVANVTRLAPARFVLGAVDGPVNLHNIKWGGGQMTATVGAESTGRLAIDVTPPSPHLITVKNEKYGDSFEPPNSHLGERLKDTSPRAVASLWLDYLERLIEESAARVTS